MLGDGNPASTLVGKSAQVTSQGDLAACADRRTVNVSDDRHRGGLDGGEHVLHGGPEIIGVHTTREIRPGAKDRPLAADQDGAHPGGSVGADGLGDRGGDGCVEGVALLRSV